MEGEGDPEMVWAGLQGGAEHLGMRNVRSVSEHQGILMSTLPGNSEYSLVRLPRLPMLPQYNL